VSKNPNKTQLAFDLPHRAAMGRDDFLVASSNEQAVKLIDEWPNWPNPVLILVGPGGSGKSHLAHVWQQVSDAELMKMTDLEDNSISDLGGAALILEDVPEEGFSEQGLFHLINMARETGGHILITANSFPTRWRVELPDLISRLRAASVAELKEPDDFLLKAILVKLFADRQLRVDEKIINYLISRMERSVDFARRAVKEIDELALERKSNITRALVADVLEDLLPKLL
jgi:chromosomal replication initiation ATPase DnaA